MGQLSLWEAEIRTHTDTQRRLGLIVNFTHQLSRPWGVSVRVFLDQINTEFSRAKQTALPDVVGPVQSAESPNKTEELHEREL